MILFCCLCNGDFVCVCVFVQAEENLGMVMIFTLVTAVQEKLNEVIDQMKIRREEEKNRKEREAEEAEKVTRTHTHTLKCSRDFYWLCLK